MSGYPTFSDFAADEIGPLDGAKKRIDDILNHQILITGFRIQDSRYDKNQSGKYLTIQFTENDNENVQFVVFTGSDVLINQFQKYGDKIPFWAVIKKNHRYYTLT